MEIKRETSYVRSIRCPEVYCDSQADYILPDYLGGVRKILFTDATIRPAGRFAGGEEVEFSGVVVYNVIYLDEEGRLSSAEFTSDYDYSVKCSEEDYRDSVSDTKIAAFSVRLVGPRKMSARCSLVGCVRLSEKVGLSIDGDVFEGEYAPEVGEEPDHKSVAVFCCHGLNDNGFTAVLFLIQYEKLTDESVS